ncbi:DhNV_027 [Dikerogammarus haemobaphes nudivirus]|nr:DhNV_027 [Dikerogammarus haemobaphes nudivirus]
MSSNRLPISDLINTEELSDNSEFDSDIENYVPLGRRPNPVVEDDESTWSFTDAPAAAGPGVRDVMLSDTPIASTSFGSVTPTSGTHQNTVSIVMCVFTKLTDKILHVHHVPFSKIKF